MVCIRSEGLAAAELADPNVDIDGAYQIARRTGGHTASGKLFTLPVLRTSSPVEPEKANCSARPGSAGGHEALWHDCRGGARRVPGPGPSVRSESPVSRCPGPCRAAVSLAVGFKFGGRGRGTLSDRVL